MRYMNLREFLRGGYKEVDDRVVVTKHGQPLFIALKVDLKLAAQDFQATEQRATLPPGPTGPSPNGG